MGYHLAETVYRIERGITSPSEQAVLAALAFRTNDKTLLCYPKQDTIVRMTHLSRSTVAAALKSLRAKKFITWIRGGNAVKRRKGGSTVSNVYALNIRMLGELTGRKMPIAEAAAKLGAAEAGDAKPDAGADGAAANQPAAVQTVDDDDSRVKNFSPIRWALAILGFVPGTRAYKDNYHAYMKWMKLLGEERSRQVVRDFARDLRDQEFEFCDNLPGLMMSRLQDAVEFCGAQDQE